MSNRLLVPPRDRKPVSSPLYQLLSDAILAIICVTLLFPLAELGWVLIGWEAFLPTELTGMILGVSLAYLWDSYVK